MRTSRTLRARLKTMAPDYRKFWNELSAYSATVDDETERAELHNQLEDLADRKAFSLADWEMLTAIESKLMMDRTPSVAQTRKLLTAGLQRFRR